MYLVVELVLLQILFNVSHVRVDAINVILQEHVHNGQLPYQPHVLLLDANNAYRVQIHVFFVHHIYLKVHVFFLVLKDFSRIQLVNNVGNVILNA